jgi:hypothetical protein
MYHWMLLRMYKSLKYSLQCRRSPPFLKSPRMIGLHDSYLLSLDTHYGTEIRFTTIPELVRYN